MTSPREHTSAAVTQLLSRARQGDCVATNELFPLVYEELRTLAATHMAGERREHTLSPTALVHEAYLRLVGPSDTSWDNRAHFFGAAAIAIRRILTDHARARARDKRGGGASPVRLEGDTLASAAETIDHASLDDALTKLAALDPQKARIVELRYYVGLPVDEVARALGVSASTVAREWAFARTWLRRELSQSEAR
ncbi:MAG: sigma-70 family RNA polymerase sigma factor [Leptolyngbya sp. PLA1]|nr:sigma-70 family RNA polymerase sigma factor [Leptolyngbya sp. PLA1]